MNEQETPSTSLLDKIEELVRSTIELLKLNVIERSADLISSFVSRLVIIVMASLSILILNVGIALFIGSILGQAFYGFFIVGGLYGFAAILIGIYRHEWLKDPISNYLVKQIQKQKKHE